MSSMSNGKSLVMLPCHSIWKFYSGEVSRDPELAGKSDSEWSLLSFQKQSQDQLIFIKHLKRAIEIVSQDDTRILIISGGATKLDTGPVTEAQSYYYLAETLGLLNDSIRQRIFLENYARDSFENLMFSVAKFIRIFGEVPVKTTVVGFKFKQHRFLSQHGNFLGLNTDYAGIDPVLQGATQEQNDDFIAETTLLENKNAVNHFDVDPCGIKSVLKNKKNSRDPFQNGAELNYNPPVVPSDEEVYQNKTLLQYYTIDEIKENMSFLKIYIYIYQKILL